MTDDFETGREYERIDKNKFFHLFLGWGCVIMSPIWFFFSTWSFKMRFYGGIGILAFGLLALSLGYLEKKQLKELMNGNRKN